MFKQKCPKCGQKHVNAVRETLADNLKRSMVNVAIPVRLLFGAGKKPKPLFVCTDCGFSWEKR